MTLNTVGSEIEPTVGSASIRELFRIASGYFAAIFRIQPKSGWLALILAAKRRRTGNSASERRSGLGLPDE